MIPYVYIIEKCLRYCRFEILLRGLSTGNLMEIFLYETNEFPKLSMLVKFLYIIKSYYGMSLAKHFRTRAAQTFHSKMVLHLYDEGIFCRRKKKKKRIFIMQRNISLALFVIFFAFTICIHSEINIAVKGVFYMPIRLSRVSVRQFTCAWGTIFSIMCFRMCAMLYFVSFRSFYIFFFVLKHISSSCRSILAQSSTKLKSTVWWFWIKSILPKGFCVIFNWIRNACALGERNSFLSDSVSVLQLSL